MRSKECAVYPSGLSGAVMGTVCLAPVAPRCSQTACWQVWPASQLTVVSWVHETVPMFCDTQGSILEIS